MNIIDIIEKKKNKQILTKEEINYAVNGYIDGTIRDYQMSSLLMAININGMTDEEVIELTEIMLHSGEVIDLSSIDGVIVDKHSTGGVGDKTSLIVAPIVACSDIKVAKMSGRGLGHTGGTIDKLESIKGLNVNLTNEQFINQVNEIGLAIVSGGANLVPADKKIYALRDVTGNVESIPLIASSIMSKKLASGASKIVIDLKLGNGALIKNIDDAKKLASLMVKIGKSHQKEVVVLITNMDQPLGCAIGNSLEVIESIDLLKGKGPKDLLELVIYLSATMISIGKNIPFDKAKEEVIDIINSGKAYNKFNDWILKQGGDLSSLQVAPKLFSIKSSKEGYIAHIDTLKIGELVRTIGAGRLTKEDTINYKVGFLILKKIGDYINVNDEIMRVYLDKTDLKINDILECFTFQKERPENKPLIIDIVR